MSIYVQHRGSFPPGIFNLWLIESMQVEPEMLLIYNDLGIQGQFNIQVSMTIIYYV